MSLVQVVTHSLLIAHPESCSKICLHHVLVSASREMLHSGITTIWPWDRHIKAKDHQFPKFFKQFRAKIAEFRAPFLMAHYESTQEKCCSFQLLEKSHVLTALQHIGSLWSNSGRTLQLFVISICGYTKSMAVTDPYSRLCQILEWTTLGQPWGNQESERWSWERQRVLQSSSNGQGMMGYITLCGWPTLLFGQPLVAVTLGCPQEPSPLTAVSQLSNTCLNLNSLEKAVWQDTVLQKHRGYARQFREGRVLLLPN